MNTLQRQDNNSLLHRCVVCVSVAVGCLLLLAGCKRDDLCFLHPTGAKLLVEIDWQTKAKVTPNAATILIYNAETGALLREEILTTNCNRHELKDMQVGKYSFIVFNETRTGSHFDLSLSYRNYTDWSKFEAYVFPETIGRFSAPGFTTGNHTRTIYTNPDTLSVSRMLNYEVTPEMINYVHKDPAPKDNDLYWPVSDVIRFTPERVISVVNVLLEGKNLSSMGSYSCFLSGMAEGYFMGSDNYSSVAVIHPVAFTKTVRDVNPSQPGLKTSFSVMGLLDGIHPGQVTVENAYTVDLRAVQQNGDIHLKNYDLIKEDRMKHWLRYVNGYPHDVIDIRLNLDLPYIPVSGGDVITDIEDWNDQTVNLETTVLRFHPNQGSGNMEPIRRGYNITFPLPQCNFKAPTEPEGWVFRFKEWNTQNDGKGNSYQPVDLFKMPRGGATLYAIWEKVE